MTFPIFSAGGLKNNVELRPGTIAMKNINMPFLHRDWDADKTTTKLPALDLIQSWAASLTRDYAFVDIEHLDLHPDSPDYQAGIDYHEYVLTNFRELRPDIVWGSYGSMPRREYWNVQPDAKLNDPASYADWIRENDTRLQISEWTDITLPSIYTFYEDQDGWEHYAIENILQAKRTGKPVYPFLWPAYHMAAKPDALRFTHIPGDYWRRQLEVCKTYADGIVIWTYSREFDPTWPWWMETADFISSLGNDPVPVPDPVPDPDPDPVPEPDPDPIPDPVPDPVPVETFEEIWFGTTVDNVNKYVLHRP